jgi:hypothetical protein
VVGGESKSRLEISRAIKLNLQKRLRIRSGVRITFLFEKNGIMSIFTGNMKSKRFVEEVKTFVLDKTSFYNECSLRSSDCMAEAPSQEAVGELHTQRRLPACNKVTRTKSNSCC